MLSDPRILHCARATYDISIRSRSYIRCTFALPLTDNLRLPNMHQKGDQTAEEVEEASLRARDRFEELVKQKTPDHLMEGKLRCGVAHRLICQNPYLLSIPAMLTAGQGKGFCKLLRLEQADQAVPELIGEPPGEAGRGSSRKDKYGRPLGYRLRTVLGLDPVPSVYTHHWVRLISPEYLLLIFASMQNPRTQSKRVHQVLALCGV